VRAWQLRENVTIDDGVFVALAEAVDQPLVTTDLRLARADRRGGHHAPRRRVTSGTPRPTARRRQAPARTSGAAGALPCAAQAPVDGPAARSEGVLLGTTGTATS
jgi:hypothetical protein